MVVNTEDQVWFGKTVTYEERKKAEESGLRIIREAYLLCGEDGSCAHNVVALNQGGIKCTKCGAWFCF